MSCSSVLRRILVRVERFELRAFDQQGDEAGGRPGHLFPPADDHLGDGLEADRLGQPGAQRVKPVRPRRERPILDFAFSKRFLHPLPFAELDIRPLAIRLGIGACPLRVLVSDGAVERLRRELCRTREELPLLRGRRVGTRKAKRDDAECPVRDEERQHDGGLAVVKERIGREMREGAMMIGT